MVIGSPPGLAARATDRLQLVVPENGVPGHSDAPTPKLMSAESLVSIPVEREKGQP